MSTPPRRNSPEVTHRPCARAIPSSSPQLFGSGMQFVEQVGIHSDACSQNEKSGLSLAAQVQTRNSSESDSLRNTLQCCFRGRRNLQRKVEIVGYCVGRSDRQNSQSDGGIRENLSDVVDSTVTTAREDRVAASRYRSLGLVTSVIGRLGG